MSYIITQSESITVNDIRDIDAMIDTTGEEIYCFKYYADDELYLLENGVRKLSNGFPFNIKIERLQ